MKKLLSFVLAVTMLAACFVFAPVEASAAGESKVVIYQQLTGNNPYHFVHVSLNGHNVPAEYMAEGYTFKYDLIMDRASAGLGIVYLDNSGNIWDGAHPWEGPYYFESMDFSDIAAQKWGTVEMSTYLMGGVAGKEVTHLLLCGSGNGVGQTAYMRNFRIENAEGEIVWAVDAWQLGNPEYRDGFCNFGFAAAKTEGCELVLDTAMGISGVTVNEETGYWRVDAWLYANVNTHDFKPDAWFGIYESSIPNEQITSSAAGMNSWAYISSSSYKEYGTGVSTTSNALYRFYIDSNNAGSPPSGGLSAGSHPNGPQIGCDDLKLVVFLSDGQYGISGYIPVADAAFTLEDGWMPATEAPATEAPTEAPATQAPATEAPATEAPATEAPATEAPVEFQMGISNVTVDPATGYWRVDCWAENFVGDFKPDAWFGIYDASVTQAQLSQYRGSAGLSAWAYIKTSSKDTYTDHTVPSGRIEFYIDSTNPTGLGDGNINIDKYGADGLMQDAIGLTDLKIVVFYSDGQFGIDGYIVAGEAAFDLVPETPATEAPATEAPATEAPATEAPAPEFSWGISNVTVDAANNYWKVDLYINNPTADFWSDAWFGIYDRSVDQAKIDNTNPKGDVGFSAWDYIFADRVVGSTTFSIDSNNGYYKAGVNLSNIWRDTYPMFDDQHFNLTGCENLQIILFYTDGQGGYGYQIADTVELSLANTVETEPADNADELVGDYFYAGGEQVGNYFGLVQYQDNYYYVDRAGKIVKNTVHYVLNANGYDVAPGNYWFDENGVLSTLSGLVGDCFYLEDGTRAPSYYGLVNVDGAFYYIDKDAKAVSGKVHYVWTTNELTWADGTAVAEGWYEFDENGALVNPGVRNGLVGDFYYVDDVRMPSYYGLVEIDGDYYYVDKDAKIVKGKSHYVLTTNGLKERGFYAFDENGKMI